MKLFQYSTKRLFSAYDLPIINLNKFQNKQEGWEKECKIVSDCLHETGVLCVKDQSVNEEDNQRFLRMMEKYFEKASSKYYSGEKVEEIFAEHAFQHGATPEFKEKARDHTEKIQKYSSENKPMSKCPPEYDAKWRYFWMVGERNKELDEGMIIYPNTIPKGFPQWETIMDTWGNKMLSTCEIVSRMTALGLKLPENTLSEKMKFGGHLLAPTGSDLNKFDVGTVFAGYHYDLNYLTIHGKSNYGGLFIWLRNGQKKQVKIPDGCLLLQSGAQMEYLTGGYIHSGFHEVIYTEEVKRVVEKIKTENKTKPDSEKKSLWRVSSTLFSQIRQNVLLEPLEHFKTTESKKKYPPILTRDQIAEELKAISLMTN